MKIKIVLHVLLVGMLFSSNAFSQDRITELNTYWKVVKEKVEAGDVDGYAATYHEDGILVSDNNKSCYSVKEALENWRDGLEKTKKGITKVNLDFRFSDRRGDAVTAFEKGIFRYDLVDEKGQQSVRFVHFEGLLTKKNGKWLLILEHQKLPATKEEWLSLSQLD
ncbi:nuclear transport factor 2 family protein [Maribacter sp. MMG018]|uniref:YybH family protein n=1 Tax=Maribacter sp. MMG018 TaxID=2822688 RepID=UPI001B3851C8|nr:nuclear transport factor 2 family protein [Maribacter sp. MMG018]MBQ4913921.1 nuclear transport factor 2 family protein [Maribacter sp. MMG018]